MPPYPAQRGHTVRGFIAGAAQKKLGLSVESFKNGDGARTYRVVA
ncbi:MAG: DUF3489 domain-containing protein [Acidobacteriota bacterium]|nr:DUF3489 domain-containing protein [Acidobacteriota bacterium]MDQ2843773.1 DUF3489 domain-containing protein [Acidobacteriota bacterium]